MSLRKKEDQMWSEMKISLPGLQLHVAWRSEGTGWAPFFSFLDECSKALTRCSMGRGERLPRTVPLAPGAYSKAGLLQHRPYSAEVALSQSTCRALVQLNACSFPITNNETPGKQRER